METVRHEHRHLEVRCDLSPLDTRRQLGDWQRLRRSWLIGVEARPGGYRMLLKPEARNEVLLLVGREAACCGFLDLEVGGEGQMLWLDISSQAEGAGPVIEALLRGDGTPGSTAG